MKTSLCEVRTGTREDEAQLRKLLRETVIEGAIPVTLEREPSFFAADVDVLRHDVALATEGEAAVSCGSRVLRRAVWGGELREVAYLCDLRVHPRLQKRAGRLLREGFRHLLLLASGHPAVVTWTAVFGGNRKALHTLTGSRAGLPAYVDRGKLVCLMLWAGRWATWPAGRGCRMAASADWPAMADFFNRHSGRQPLAPVLRGDDFDKKRWLGLSPEDFVLLFEKNELAGMAAVWDQRVFKQVRVARLPRWMAWLRQPMRLASRWLPCPRLPAPGTVMAVASAAFLAVRDNDPTLCRRLLRAARSAAGRRGLDFLCVCLHEHDAKTRALAGLPATSAHGRLFQVGVAGDEPWTEDVPYIDPAFL